MIEERDQGLREVEEQIGQINEIFKDLDVLVHDQGIVIDDIQSNIDTSASTTAQAKVQLAKASKSVKSKTSWYWWVLAIFIVVVIILVIALII
ncbi:syntaxin-21-like [Cicer arietinum]|uniref:Syntaxin-22-like n=1 Tax=Cicer arietinum TaxID=3827 RepID=A0A3Q7XMJ5_CICAR|nr:syntaxin-22-like [Cicer arietinum]